jgi:hypothetical protein
MENTDMNKLETIIVNLSDSFSPEEIAEQVDLPVEEVISVLDAYGDEMAEFYDMDDVEADADALRGIGWGTDEDYGYFGDEF